MGIGVWEPASESVISQEKIGELIVAAKNAGDVHLADVLDGDFIERNGQLMRQNRESWQKAEDLDADDLETLIRFFTLAEAQLPGWNGGNQCPVIYLVRILKSRGLFTPELRKWIKTNTDNRYLPYGSAL